MASGVGSTSNTSAGDDLRNAYSDHQYDDTHPQIATWMDWTRVQRWKKISRDMAGMIINGNQRAT